MFHWITDRWVRVLVFNATFNRISVISVTVCLAEQNGLTGENHPPAGPMGDNVYNDIKLKLLFSFIEV
jgi:hypothetical protein